MGPKRLRCPRARGTPSPLLQVLVARGRWAPQGRDKRARTLPGCTGGCGAQTYGVCRRRQTKVGLTSLCFTCSTGEAAPPQQPRGSRKVPHGHINHSRVRWHLGPFARPAPSRCLDASLEPALPGGYLPAHTTRSSPPRDVRMQTTPLCGSLNPVGACVISRAGSVPCGGGGGGEHPTPQHPDHGVPHSLAPGAPHSLAPGPRVPHTLGHPTPWHLEHHTVQHPDPGHPTPWHPEHHTVQHLEHHTAWHPDPGVPHSPAPGSGAPHTRAPGAPYSLAPRPWGTPHPGAWSTTQPSTQTRGTPHPGTQTMPQPGQLPDTPSVLRSTGTSLTTRILIDVHPWQQTGRGNNAGW